MSDPKSQRIEELEKQVSDLQEQCSTRYEAIEKLNAEKKEMQDRFEETAANRAALIEDNNRLICEKNKLMEKLDAAEIELEKANAVFKNEFEKRSSLQRQYDEIKIKNANICSTIADMVRKIMIE